MQQDADVNRSFLRRRLLGETQQICNQITGTPRLAYDFAHQRVLFVGEPFLRPKSLGITHDGA